MKQSNLNESSNEQLENSLNQLLQQEEEKLSESIQKKEENNEQKGITQIIGRRMGYFWEEFCHTLINNSYTDTENDEFILKLNTIIEIIEQEIGDLSESNEQDLREALEALNSLDIVKEGEELADIEFKDDKNYAIQFKWSFRSNDAKTVRQLANSAEILKKLDYKPIMLIKRPREENLESPIRRFEKAGWDVKCGEDAVEFLEDKTKFSVKDWVEGKVDFWELLEENREYLNSVGWSKEELEF